MPQIQIDDEKHILKVPIVLTATKSKIQIKNRSRSNEYGVPVATVRDGFTLDSYIEWMIGYDVKWGTINKKGEKKKTKNEDELKKLNKSTLKDTCHFIGSNGYIKALYELSEYIYYFYKWGVLSKQDLTAVKDFLDKIQEKDLIENNVELQIDRGHPVRKKIDGFDFEYTQVKYPLLVYKFGDEYKILTEIKISEKQYAVGVQPMMYLCFPVTKLQSDGEPLVGRKAKTKEKAFFEINVQNIKVFLEILKIFGILSESHKTDVERIIETIIDRE